MPREGTKILYQTRIGGRLFVRTTKEWGEFDGTTINELYIDLIERDGDVDIKVRQLDVGSFFNPDQAKRDHEGQVETLKMLYRDLARVVQSSITGGLDKLFGDQGAG